MIEVDQALKKIIDNIPALPPEFVSLNDALSRVLSEDIFSDIDIPEFDNSAMDGYAVISDDISKAHPESPISLNVIDEIRAGVITNKELKSKQAIRIMTGAVIPGGANAVVMVENTQTKEDDDKGNKFVNILEKVSKGENIRKASESVKKGELVIKKGEVLNPAHIGMFATLGITQVKVSRKPKVAILATGDELVEIDEKLEKGKIRNSNTYALYAQIQECGGTPINKGIAKDNIEELKEKITGCLDCDLILTCGGVSAGDYDFVKVALESLGTDIKFWKVAMKPGKPILFGLLGNKPVFGLPGNPVSSMINVEVFVKPAIFKMLRCSEKAIKQVDATLEEDLVKKNKRRNFIRAFTRWDDGQYFTKPTGPQGSGILKSMVLANSLIIFPEEQSHIKKGTRVTVSFLS